MHKRTLIALLVGMMVFATSFAFAAGLGGLSTGTVGAGDTAVAACDTNGVSTSYAVVVATAAFAAAATVALTSRSLGVGTVALARCDTNGFTVSYTVSSGNINNVTVGDIADPDCEGGTLKVTAVSSTGTSLGASANTTLSTDGDTNANSQSVAISPSASETNTIGIHVSVTGP